MNRRKYIDTHQKTREHLRNWPLLLSVFCILISGFNGTGQEIDHNPGKYRFMENKGQWPDHVAFKADLEGSGNIWLEKSRIIYHFYKKNDFHEHMDEKHPAVSDETQEHLIYAKFLNSNPNPTFEKLSPFGAYYNFFLGNDESKWARGVKAYNEVQYNGIYNNIDLRFYEQKGQLKYEYHVAPQGDPSTIQLKYFGAEKVKLTSDGNIIVKGPLGEIIEEKPFAYQIKNGRILKVECAYVLSTSGVLTFELGEFDSSVELIIDPVLVFATYSGSVTDNFGMTATYAHDGKAYSAGMVYGNAYPAPAPAWNNTPNITVASTGVATTDAFVSKYSADGTTMIWTNFVGGGDNTQGTETVHSLICDSSNNVYMYGVTSSLDFPLMNAFQTTHGGGSFLSVQFNGTNFGTAGTDIYVTKISSDGLSLLGSTYVGGSANDGVNYKVSSGTYNSVTAYDSLTTNYGDQFRGEIMLDSLNNILIASSTRSTDFPTFAPFQPANAGQQDGVVFKLSADFSSLLWSSYYGGSQNDACYSVKIDSSYNVLITGGTSSTNLPATAGAYTPTYQGGKTDGYVAKITPDGSALIRTSYIGTSVYDQSIFVEIDRWDNVYLVGQSLGSMPVINAPYSNPNSKQFIMKLNPDLTSIVYSTVFGNGMASVNISPSAFLVDVCGNVYVSGWGGNILSGGSATTGMPITSDAYLPTSPNGFDFYLFVLERDALSLLYASYMGGNIAKEHVDGGTSRFDKFGVVYQSVCGGCGGNSDFPTTPGAWSSQNLSSNCNNLIFKFDFEIVPDADFTISDVEGCAPFTFILDNESNDTINSVWNFPTEAIILQGGVNPEIMFADPGTYEIYLSITDTICNLVDTAMKVVNVYPAIDTLITSSDTVICDDQPFDLWATTYGTANNYIWSDVPNFTNQLNSGPLDSVITVNPLVTTTYYVMVSNGWALCNKIDSVVVEVMDGPDADFLVSDLEGCIPLTVDLDNESSDTLSSVWNFPPGTTVITGGVNPQIVFVAPGVYDILLTLYDPICNITDSATQTITVHEGISLTVPNDTVVCDFPTIDLTANSFGTATSFFWSDDPTFTTQLNTGPMDSTISVSPTVSTTYYVTVSNGWPVCDLVDSVQVLFVDDAVELSPNDTICRGDSTLIMATTPLPPGQISYSWSPVSDIVVNHDSLIIVKPQVSQWFYLTWSTTSGCIVYDSVWIEVTYLDPASVYATATPDSVAEGATTLLEAFPNNPNFSYLWFPPTSVADPTAQSTTATVNEPTTFEVIVNGNGCVLKTPVTVYTYEFVCGDIYIFIPSAFTPNGDGENDKVFVRGQNLVEINLKIFDRWGELVFETNDQSMGWDGTFKGRPSDPDVYVYHLTAICFDGQESLIKGNISLLR